MTRSIDGGLTLMEVVVHCVLLSLFTIIVFGSIPRRQTDSMRELQQASMEANQALTEIGLDLANGNGRIVHLQNPPTLAIPVASQDRRTPFVHTSAGETLWYGWAVYRLEGDRLYRYYQAFPEPTVSARIAAEPGLELLPTSGAREVVARHLSSFQTTLVKPGLWQVSMSVALGDSEAKLSFRGRPRN